MLTDGAQGSLTELRHCQSAPGAAALLGQLAFVLGLYPHCLGKVQFLYAGFYTLRWSFYTGSSAHNSKKVRPACTCAGGLPAFPTSLRVTETG